MTRSLQSLSLKFQLQGTIQNAATTSQTAKAPLNHEFKPTLANGTAEDQANRAQEYTFTITSGNNEVIDLYDFVGTDLGGGDGKDVLGQAVQNDEIVVFVIENTSGDTGGVLEVEPDATNGWTPIGTHTVATGGGISPGGIIIKIETDAGGFAVTDASSHRIKITANGGDITGKITILGRDT